MTAAGPPRQIAADQDVCIASENCTEVAPATFGLDDSGLVRVLTPRPVDEVAAERAVVGCPVNALRWVPDNDQQNESQA